MRNNLNWDIIKKFSSEETPCFSLEDVITSYPDRGKNYLAKVLSKMVAEGVVIRLKKGLYHIVPLNEDADHFIPDWHLVAKYLMKRKRYYIGYYSAMQIHGLITQPSLKEIIVTDIQVKPNITKINNAEFQFVHHIDKRFFGFENTWIDDYNKVQCSDLEKTIVDALGKPHYSGGMVEIGKAIHETRKKINIEKIVEYLLRFESQTAIKRYLFISNLLDIWSDEHQRLLSNTGSSISPLDTTAPNEGKINTKFGLRVNINPETIKEAIFT
ncbi:transcriptional regulator [Fulvivirga sp. M361]|uniref:type IV toxin-antitoxin system AbiEi family antitoxin domain-containing protein n=1 Tax=Fulvivirga sp. M361 TaxID=2594266 RepID=UPI00117BC2A2|nr:transcriptional regulator [Fulvivirga sp. M361]TRX46322.1 transcriptional regulator [Fulvivirga sp. M361]